MRLHLHRDPDWINAGLYRYEKCKCGAVRVTKFVTGLHGPADPGWNSLLRDKHNQVWSCSGWVNGTNLVKPVR